MRIWSIVGLLGLIALAGCGGSSHAFVSAATRGQQERLALRSVACDPSEVGCNDAHLVKGEACFRLAKAGDEHFQGCAVRHLAIGLDMTDAPTVRASQQVYFESLMEALRLRRDTAPTRREAAPFAAQLESRAVAFRNAFPTAPAGYFYLLSARLKKAEDSLERAPALACRALGDADALLREIPDDRGAYGPGLRRAELEFSDLQERVSPCADV